MTTINDKKIWESSSIPKRFKKTNKELLRTKGEDNCLRIITPRTLSRGRERNLKIKGSIFPPAIKISKPRSTKSSKIKNQMRILRRDNQSTYKKKKNLDSIMIIKSGKNHERSRSSMNNRSTLNGTGFERRSRSVLVNDADLGNEFEEVRNYWKSLNGQKNASNITFVGFKVGRNLLRSAGNESEKRRSLHHRLNYVGK